MKKAYRLLSGGEINFFPGIFILCLLVSQSFAQPASVIQWQKCYGGTLQEGCLSIIKTFDNGFVAMGATLSNDSDVVGNHGVFPYYDYWVIKTDSAGNLQWQRCLGGTGHDRPSSVIQTNDSGYIVAGYATGNSGDITGNHSTGEDCWLVKLNSSGNIVWQKCYGGSGNEGQNIKLIKTYDGGYAFGASTMSSNGDVIGNHGPFGTVDLWVVKLDIAGNIQWQKCLGGTSHEYCYSLIQTSDSGFAATGMTQSNDGDVSGNHGGIDGWVVKLDAAGNIQWQKCLGGSGTDRAELIMQTNDSGFMVYCLSDSTDGDFPGGCNGFWYVKLNAAGNIQSQNCFSSYSYVFCCTDVPLLYPVNDGGYILIGTDLVNTIWYPIDAVAIKLDSNMNIQWKKKFSGTGGVDLYTGLQLSDNSFVMGGGTSSNDGDMSGSGNHGGYDFWIVKFDVLNWISGTVYNDINHNCIRDAGEPPLVGRWVTVNPPGFSMRTDSFGFYSFLLNPGTYNVSLNPSTIYNTNCPSSGSYSINLPAVYTGSTNNDFADTVAVYCPDLSISIGTWVLRPCFQNTYSVMYCNNGTVDSYNDSIVITFPSSVIPLSSTIPWTIVAPNTYSFIIDTLLAGQCGTFFITDSVSCSQQVGDTLCVSAVITTLAECYTGDNTDVDCHVTTSSCDPNSKEVSVTNSSVISWVSSGNILNTDTLEYQINFQNTGTDTAWTVVIMDTLSSNLDFSSFTQAGSSHPCEVTYYNAGVVMYTLNILLPDSNIDEPGSHGFVKFKIRQKSGNAPGTQIFNSAAIVFDYNLPVVTNTTICTVVDTATGINELQKSATVIYPNPATNFIALDPSVQLQNAKILITDAYGKIVSARKISSNAFDISRLAQGVYFVKIITHDGSTRVFRFIKG